MLLYCGEKSIAIICIPKLQIFPLHWKTAPFSGCKRNDLRRTLILIFSITDEYLLSTLDFFQQNIVGEISVYISYFQGCCKENRHLRKLRMRELSTAT